MQKIGVFVCHCGSNIAATVDVAKVVEMAKMEPGVVHAEDYQYMCSEAGQLKIQTAIREKGLTGVVVCSCSPRMHETTFRKCAERAGLNLPEDQLLAKEQQSAVLKAMSELPPDFREILQLRGVEELPYEEIAEILDIKVGTVKSRLARARNQLRKNLEDGNFFEPASSKKAGKGV